MNRRELLAVAGGATLGAWLASMAQAEDKTRQRRRVLYFTKSAGFEHSVIKRQKDPKTGEEKLSHSEKILTEIGAKNNFEVVHSKDGTIFTSPEFQKFDAVFFYTSGDLLTVGKDGNPAMSKEGKEALLNFVKDGKGFLAAHAASDSFHASPVDADRYRNFGEKVDPYIAMLGAEFMHHGEQQRAKLICPDPKFPGFGELTEGVELLEEWYALKDFAQNMHVLLVQETTGMKGQLYARPRYPSTWARAHGKGRVFYTSLGHREDVWSNPTFQNVLAGAISWATGNVEADVTPNLATVAPQCLDLGPPPQKK